MHFLNRLFSRYTWVGLLALFSLKLGCFNVPTNSGSEVSLITPGLQQLHWLPIWQKIEFKVNSLMHEAFNQASASCLAKQVSFAWQSAAKQLRSSTAGAAVVQRVKSKLCHSSEDLVFSAAGLELTQSHNTFRRKLKSHLHSLPSAT